MSLQPSAEDAPAVETTKNLRPVLAWGLLGANALWLFLALEAFLIPSDDRGDFGDRALAFFGDSPAGISLSMPIALVGAAQIAFPAIAVWIVTHIKPGLQNPKPYFFVALGEYAVSALFGLIAFFASFAADAASSTELPDGSEISGALSGRDMTEITFARLGLFALLGLAAFWVFKVAQPQLMPPPQPYAGQWQGQQQWGQPYAGGPQQGWPQPGQPGVGMPQPAPGQQQWPQPNQPGVPQMPPQGTQPPQPGQQWPQQG